MSYQVEKIVTALDENKDRIHDGEIPVLRDDKVAWIRCRPGELSGDDQELLTLACGTLKRRAEETASEAVKEATFARRMVLLFHRAQEADPSIEYFGQALEWAKKNAPDLLKEDQGPRLVN